MEAVLWAAGLLFGFVILYLIDRREKKLKSGEKELVERFERRVIYAFVLVGITVPVAYFLPRFGVGLDFVDIFVGALLSAIAWVITGEIREEL